MSKNIDLYCRDGNTKTPSYDNPDENYYPDPYYSHYNKREYVSCFPAYYLLMLNKKLSKEKIL
jgi:hypothetical protein